MRNILSRLLAMGQFEVIIFGDKAILDDSAPDPLPQLSRLTNTVHRH